MTGPLLTATLATALFVFGAYVSIASPRLSGGTLLGLALMALATWVIFRLLDTLGRRHGVSR